MVSKKDDANPTPGQSNFIQLARHGNLDATNKEGNVTNSRAHSLIGSRGISWRGILNGFTLSEWHNISMSEIFQ